MIDSRECPCCGREDTSEEVFEGTQLPCGCPCYWSVDVAEAYINKTDEHCEVCEEENRMNDIADITKRRARKMLEEGAKEDPMVAELVNTYFYLVKKGYRPINIMHGMLSMGINYFAHKSPEHGPKFVELILQQSVHNLKTIMAGGLTAAEMVNVYTREEALDQQLSLFALIDGEEPPHVG